MWKSSVGLGRIVDRGRLLRGGVGGFGSVAVGFVGCLRGRLRVRLGRLVGVCTLRGILRVVAPLGRIVAAPLGRFVAAPLGRFVGGLLGGFTVGNVPGCVVVGCVVGGALVVAVSVVAVRAEIQVVGLVVAGVCLVGVGPVRVVAVATVTPGRAGRCLARTRGRAVRGAVVRRC